MRKATVKCCSMYRPMWIVIIIIRGKGFKDLEEGLTVEEIGLDKLDLESV